MNLDVVITAVTAFMNQVPLLIQRGLEFRLSAAKSCPTGGWVELSLLQGHCRHCGSNVFFLFQSLGYRYLAVQCTECHWTSELSNDRWWGTLGRYLLRCAINMPLGVIRQGEPSTLEAGV